MTIAEAGGKCKSLAACLRGTVARVPRDVLVLGILVLASASSFGLGLLAGLDERKGNSIMPETAPVSAAETAPGVGVVASKNGTKYYYPECAGAHRIMEANKIWFASASSAETAGYALAANCVGR